MKSSFISIMGRPSAGKSTLLNKICGEKISIIAPTPQTTRNKIRGILSEERGQLIFIDTPGFHLSEKKLNLHLKDVSISSLDESDLFVYVIDTTRTIGTEEKELLSIFSSMQEKTIVALNKCDIASSKVKTYSHTIKELLPGCTIVEISALKGTGIENLKDVLFSKAAEGEQMYPDDFYTDQLPEFRISEIIREKAINSVKEEIPHAVYVEVADLEISEDGEKGWIRAFIMVERETQKGIIVGKGGAGIRDIRKAAQKELNRIFPYKIYLDLRVKVNHKWRKKDHILKKLIF
ncbi:MAG: GTPase Era [Spirochaetes bacterium]|nr:MAG: GTPase Era [Spirochaetota bacterium]